MTKPTRLAGPKARVHREAGARSADQAAAERRTSLSVIASQHPARRIQKRELMQCAIKHPARRQGKRELNTSLPARSHRRNTRPAGSKAGVAGDELGGARLNRSSRPVTNTRLAGSTARVAVEGVLDRVGERSRTREHPARRDRSESCRHWPTGRGASLVSGRSAPPGKSPRPAGTKAGGTALFATPGSKSGLHEHRHKHPARREVSEKTGSGGRVGDLAPPGEKREGNE